MQININPNYINTPTKPIEQQPATAPDNNAIQKPQQALPAQSPALDRGSLLNLLV